jgi:hypothetical protein
MNGYIKEEEAKERIRTEEAKVMCFSFLRMIELLLNHLIVAMLTGGSSSFTFLAVLVGKVLISHWMSFFVFFLAVSHSFTSQV